jgi:regulatory protein
MKGEYQYSKAERKRSEPLNADSLRSLALAYVGRYATSCARLTGYLNRKIAQRGGIDEPHLSVSEIVSQFRSLGYVDDEAFAKARSESLMRRGYGPNRLRNSLQASGIGTDIIDRTADLNEEDAFAAAVLFAKRKRIGPYAKDASSPVIRQKMIAALLRAGHSYEVSRKILALTANDIATR